MSKFWQKKYISKYTGAEIDAAVAKADTVPAVTAADEGKALVVDSEGKIVAGEAGGGGDSNFKLAFEGDSTCIIGYDNNKQEPIMGGDSIVGIESFPYKLFFTIDEIFVYFCIKLTDADIANLRSHFDQEGYTITFPVDSDLDYIDFESYHVYPVIQYDDERIIGNFRLLYENSKVSAKMALPFDPVVTINIEIDIDNTKQITLTIAR